MKLELSHKLIIAILSVSLLDMAIDLRFGCFILLPLFMSVFRHHPPIFMASLLFCGFCEDVFFGKWLGMTPLLYIVFKSLYERFALVLLKLENFYILWICFILTVFAYQAAQYYLFSLQQLHIAYSLKHFIIATLTSLLFPVFFKRFLIGTRIIHGS